MEKYNVQLGYSSCNTDIEEMLECEKQLEELGFEIEKKDCNGQYPCSLLDLFPVEYLQIGFPTLLSIMAQPAAYDITKALFVKLWSSAFKLGKRSKWHKTFTIEIDGIPIGDGTSKIRCQVDGTISKKQKELVINKCFELPKQIIEKEFYLENKNDTYEIYHSHYVRINPDNGEIKEIDIKRECEGEEVN